MTLSGHTSTLPRLVIWGGDFQGHSLECRFGPRSSMIVGLLTEVMILLLFYAGPGPSLYCSASGVINNAGSRIVIHVVVNTQARVDDKTAFAVELLGLRTPVM